jgi:hypothetical protein
MVVEVIAGVMDVIALSLSLVAAKRPHARASPEFEPVSVKHGECRVGIRVLLSYAQFYFEKRSRQNSFIP